MGTLQALNRLLISLSNECFDVDIDEANDLNIYAKLNRTLSLVEWCSTHYIEKSFNSMPIFFNPVLILNKETQILRLNESHESNSNYYSIRQEIRQIPRKIASLQSLPKECSFIKFENKKFHLKFNSTAQMFEIYTLAQLDYELSDSHEIRLVGKCPNHNLLWSKVIQINIFRNHLFYKIGRR